jgi:hypothetical protein
MQFYSNLEHSVALKYFISIRSADSNFNLDSNLNSLVKELTSNYLLKMNLEMVVMQTEKAESKSFLK